MVRDSYPSTTLTFDMDQITYIVVSACIRLGRVATLELRNCTVACDTYPRTSLTLDMDQITCM